jgi:hypothetical protein
MKRIAMAVTVLVSLFAGSLSVMLAAWTSAAAAPPYAQSKLVTALAWDSAVVRIGDGTTGDNWPVTWADDDQIYASYGDGDGFSNRSPKLSLGFATLSGNPPGLTGQDFSSNIDTPEGQGPNGIKASGMLMVDGTLYMFVRNYKPDGSSDYTNSRLAWSTDHGRNWSWANWAFADTFGAPDFIQFGKNYAGARDGYVYLVSQANDSAYGWSPDVVLARVPKDRVSDRAAYEFFAGTDGSGAPQWSTDIARRKPAFSDPNGVQRIGMSYNAGLHRYVLTSAHQTGDGATHTPALGVFEAPEPWGPWGVVYYNDNFSGGYAFHHKFPTKWMSADGRSMWLLYSGSNTGASCNCVTLRKATLTLNGAPPPAATQPPAATAIPTSGIPTQGGTPPASGASGLRGDYFSDPNLTNLAFSRIDPNVDFNWRTAAAGPGLGIDNFSARWTGQVIPRFSETHTFFTRSDDGTRLWVNGKLLIDDWNKHGATERQGTIALEVGKPVDIKLEYFEFNVDATVQLSWSSPSQPKVIIPQSQLVPAGGSNQSPPTPQPTNAPPTATAQPTATNLPTTPPAPGGSSAGLTGTYFGDANFGALKLTRVDGTINFAWGNNAPAAGLPADNFSVRWSGQVIPRFSETYTFRVTADDGACLWVNGQPIIDAWGGAYGGVNSAQITLQASQPYAIKIDYREAGGGAGIKLEWSSASQKLEIVPQSQLVTASGSSHPPPAPTSVPQPTAAPPAPTNAPQPTAVPTALPAPTQAPPSNGAPKLLFGIGAEADSAIKARLTTEAPVRMLTSWYNSPNDLSWMTGWKDGLVPRAYAAGYALHLIVFTDVPETNIQTKYGTACGRPYPLSDRFLGDMQQLAQTYAGDPNGPPLYVTLFTEFQTYACTDNAWNPNAETNAYYRALKDRYMEALTVFHQHAPNAKVSLGWGGWQTRWDDPAQGAGRSMFQYFDDVMRASDFQSFQAMQSDSNVEDVRAMTRLLGAYGPVMLAHYKPDNGSASTFEQDLRAMLTDAYLADVTSAGLFAWSFMDTKNLDGSASAYQFVKDAITRYGIGPR